MTLNIKETVNCWDFLKDTQLPIYIYGMGLGAEKILKVFEQYGITYEGFFASDGFVRGHKFKGSEVLSLSAVEEKEKDFVIVLAFAAGYMELYDQILNIASRHLLLAPDVPVAGEGLFTYEYYKEHENEFEEVFENLADDVSRKTYEDIINFKISGKIEYLNDCTTSKEEVYDSIIDIKPDTTFVDMGAYKGDTIEEFLAATAKKNIDYKAIYAFEPNSKNYAKLVKNSEAMGLHDATLINGCSTDCSKTLHFTKNEGRMAKADDKGELLIEGYAADDVVKAEHRVNGVILKLDTEGAEKDALNGSANLIRNGADILCALYHRNEDMFAIPLQIKAMNPDLKLYVRHQLYIPAWETNLYAVKL